MNWEEFLTILVLVFSLVMIVAGVFTAYFGAGKSRKVGAVLILIGAVLCLIWLFLLGVFGDSGITLLENVQLWELLKETVLILVAAVIGALAAVGIFLVSVMKS